MGNARNSSKNVGAAARVAKSSNAQHHGVPHTSSPWFAKRDAAQAAKHSKQMAELNRQNEAKNE